VDHGNIWLAVEDDVYVLQAFYETARRAGIMHADPSQYRYAHLPPEESLERQKDYEQLKRIFAEEHPHIIEDLRNPHPLSCLPIGIQNRSFETFLEPPFVDPVVFSPFCPQMLQVHAADDRHLTANTEHFERVLNGLDLSGMNILEIGYGTGYLTEIILRQEVARYRGYDITEPSPDDIPAHVLQHPNAEFLVRDFREDDFSFMEDGEWAVISNPPYFLIPEIKRKIITPYQPAGTVLITSQARAKDFEGAVIESVQDGMDFDPPATGLHFVISDGFQDRWTRDALVSRQAKPKILGSGYPACPSHKYGIWDISRFSEHGIA